MNRFLGTIFAIATLVSIAFAILNFGNYTSMRSTSEPSSADADVVLGEQAEATEEETLTEPTDSLATEDVIPVAIDPTTSEE